jgi:hypothetical protein
MFALKPAVPIVTLGATFASLLVWHVAASSDGPKPKQVERKGLPAEAYYESSSCYGCHTKAQPFVDSVVQPIICRCNEFETWETTDKHRLAYAALKGERAKTMGKHLKIDVLKDRACVSCHGVWIDDAKLRDEKQTLIEEGVSCFTCHGPDKDWLDMHGSNNKARRLKWREKSRAEKHDAFGMTDLWDPVKRTRLCASCHIGDAAEGKVLTHEMYAAGHPPLPGFDMSNFSNAMRHWEYLSEKNADVIKEFKFSAAQVASEQANLVYVGNLVAFEATIRLLGSQAGSKDAWPELAHFDCYSCHHDLKANSWRQKRGYVGKPGRPQMQAWPTSLVELALHHSAAGDAKKIDTLLTEFNAKLKKLRAAYDDKPFGDPDQIGPAARDLAEWIDQQASQTKVSADITPAAYKRLLTQLIDTHKDRYLDFEAARQVAGAIRAVYTEGWKKPGVDAEVMKQLKAIDDDLLLTLDSEARLKHRDARLAITKNLASIRKTRPADLSKFLDMNLPALQDQYGTELRSFLEGVNRYDPEAFQSKLKGLSAAIGKTQRP